MTQQSVGAAGLVFIVLMAFCAVFAPLVSPYDPLTVDYGAMLERPSAVHWLGTDSFGRDVLSRIIYGSRTALAIGFIASFIGCTAGALAQLGESAAVLADAEGLDAHARSIRIRLNR